MAAAHPKLKWQNASGDNPGYSVWHARPGRDPDVLYVIRQKRKSVKFTPVGWRVFVRTTPAEALKTIYLGDTLKEAKAYVQDWENQFTSHAATMDALTGAITE